MQPFKFLLATLLVDIGALASPVSETDLTEMVKRGELKRDEDVSELEKRQCAGCGLYLCSGRDFTGDCYWGCYVPRETIQIDPYWVPRISSIGPDRGCYCRPGNKYGSCEGFSYPGGNVDDNNCKGHISLIYCF
ncbi:hypothetical protein CEP52_004492 [Fusarium oligoseptatum]|uniref:Uncharacterized protein n=1 Tax=Fusarium oligoseptatum TaxID=2604345 RepID=A0A428U390_9HYPO|nr:hypothetical protein CEP52_004492 [Fusarium oligoseptatum]